MTTPAEATPRELWERIRDKRKKAWQTGKCVPAETILEQLPSLRTDADVVAELVYQEFWLREEQGENPDPADLVFRFPEVEAELRALLSTHGQTSRGGSGYRETIDLSTHGSTLTDLLASQLNELGSDELRKGQQVGKYLLIDRLGSGAMGVVFLARDTLLDRPVALKFPRFTEDDVERGLRVRFFREARAAATLEHPNICPIYDLGEEDGQDYIAMAYVAGATLDDTVEQLGPMPLREACSTIRDVALALEECHQHGIVHRDIKPSNIVMNHRGAPVVMDFGLATMENTVRVTADDQLLGTLQYMSPEQLDGQLEQIGPHSDVYGLGATLYEVVTGQAPFSGPSFMEVYKKIHSETAEPPSSLVPTLDPRLDEICLRAIAKVPQDRFASMSDFARALETLLS